MSCRFCQTAVEQVEDIVQLLNTFLTLHRRLQRFSHQPSFCQSAVTSIDSIVVMLQTLSCLHQRLESIDRSLQAIDASVDALESAEGLQDPLL